MLRSEPTTIMATKKSLFFTLILLFSVPTRSQDCNNVTNCGECFATDGCGAWAPVAGCLGSCNVIAGASCYTNTSYPDLSVEGTCQVAAQQEADAQLCSSKTACGDCVATTLSDGNNTCQWFPDAEYCGRGCGADDCGATACTADVCDGLSCEDCLAKSCAWAPQAGCLTSCDVIADVSWCKNGTLDGMTAEETCQVAADVTAEHALLCSSKTDCGECVATALSDGNTTCHWFQDSEYCGSGCDMSGCGETTCVGGDPCDGLSCEDCLAGYCAWAPDEGRCLASCDMIANVTCFPSEDNNATTVCNTTTAPIDPTSSAPKMSTVVGIVMGWIVISINY